MKRLMASLSAIILLGLSCLIGQSNAQKKSPSVSVEVPTLTVPVKDGSLRFAIVGDTGSGTDKQQQIADRMLELRATFPFEFVLMMGDNLYGGDSAKDYEKKFESVYRRLLDDKVKFYATLGNHDDSNQRFYDHFNMNGKEYYSFKKGKATFWSLNSNYMDPRQVKWLEEEFSKDTSEWKICFMHHAPYSSGRKHGSDEGLREVLEPLMVKHGIDVVFSGHDHFYERIKPQKGIHYFVSGAAGKIRPGDVKVSKLTEKSFDQDMHFMIIEIVGSQLHFQAISRMGKTVDSGILNQLQKRAHSSQ